MVRLFTNPLSFPAPPSRKKKNKEREKKKTLSLLMLLIIDKLARKLELAID